MPAQIIRLDRPPDPVTQGLSAATSTFNTLGSALMQKQQQELQQRRFELQKETSMLEQELAKTRNRQAQFQLTQQQLNAPLRRQQLRNQTKLSSQQLDEFDKLRDVREKEARLAVENEETRGDVLEQQLNESRQKQELAANTEKRAQAQFETQNLNNSIRLYSEAQDPAVRAIAKERVLNDPNLPQSLKDEVENLPINKAGDLNLESILQHLPPDQVSAVLEAQIFGHPQLVEPSSAAMARALEQDLPVPQSRFVSPSEQLGVDFTPAVESLRWRQTMESLRRRQNRGQGQEQGQGTNQIELQANESTDSTQDENVSGDYDLSNLKREMRRRQALKVSSDLAGENDDWKRFLATDEKSWQEVRKDGPVEFLFKRSNKLENKTLSSLLNTSTFQVKLFKRWLQELRGKTSDKELIDTTRQLTEIGLRFTPQMLRVKQWIADSREALGNG